MMAVHKVWKLFQLHLKSSTAVQPMAHRLISCGPPELPKFFDLFFKLSEIQTLV